MLKNRAENNRIRETYVSPLRKVRKSKKLSLNKVSDATGISKQTLHNWENGTIKNIGPRYQNEAEKLANLYSISREQLDTLVNNSWFEFKKQTSKHQNYLKTKTYLYELRVSNCKTLQNVADALGLNIYKINQYELGTQSPSENEISKLAEYFGVSEKSLKSKMKK